MIAQLGMLPLYEFATHKPLSPYTTKIKTFRHSINPRVQNPLELRVYSSTFFPSVHGLYIINVNYNQNLIPRNNYFKRKKKIRNEKPL